MESEMHDRSSDSMDRSQGGGGGVGECGGFAPPAGFAGFAGFAASAGHAGFGPRRTVALALLALLAIAAPPPAANAQDDAKSGERITLKVMLSHISTEPGSIDKRAAQLDQKIRKDFRYESLRVLEEREMKLGINDMGSMTLPNGRQLKVTPMVIDDRGALLAVDLDGSAKADLRVKPSHLIVIGAQSYEGGKLVISLYPEF
jgi:hypothetical protein